MDRFVRTRRLLPLCLLAAGCASLARKPEAPPNARMANGMPSTGEELAPRPASAGELLDSHVKLAAYHLERQEWPQAQAFLDKALAASPQHLPALVQLSKLHRGRGDEPKARAVLQQILALDPGAPLAWNEVANLRASKGDYQGAIDALSKALERSPDHSRYLENLGAVYALAGDYDHAYEAYARALGPAEARFRLAGALYARRDLAGARQQLTLGATESPNHTPTLRMLAALDDDEAINTPVRRGPPKDDDAAGPLARNP